MKIDKDSPFWAKSIEIKIKHGCCKASFEKDFVHIHNLYINPEFRCQGKAEFLLSNMIKMIRAAGYTGPIQIVANPTEPGIDRDRLKRFYERNGLDVYSCYM